MRITAKVDYAIRAAAELAAAPAGTPTKGEALARAQDIPLRFLENILRELRHAGLVKTHRGADGGYQLARPASTINLAEIIRAVEGPLAAVQGERPEDLAFAGAAQDLPEVWIALRASLRSVLESVTLDDLAQGRLPASIRRLAADPDARKPH
jgi:Rrf2 family protein